MQIAINEDVLLQRTETLARFTHAEPAAEGTAVTRIVFTDDDLRARAG